MAEEYQDERFEVAEVQGRQVERFTCYSEQGREHPEKLLLRMAGLGWRAFFLSAFIGHWDVVSGEALEWLHQDYEGVPSFNLGEDLGLVGAVLERACCQRGVDGTSFTLTFDRGTLTVCEMDPQDPHSDTLLRWSPGQAKHK